MDGSIHSGHNQISQTRIVYDKKKLRIKVEVQFNRDKKKAWQMEVRMSDMSK